jgi:hypothetical protein
MERVGHNKCWLVGAVGGQLIGRVQLESACHAARWRCTAYSSVVALGRVGRVKSSGLPMKLLLVAQGAGRRGSK